VTSLNTSGGVAGRTFLVTGGNIGIGLATATALARDGGRVFIACRTLAKGEAAVTRIKAETGSADVFLLPLDLASLASVEACAEAFLARDEPLHVLVNNAGISGQRGFTEDGFEIQWGTNHLGHYALTHRLLPRLTESGPGARVVTVASDGHNMPTGIDFEAVRQPTPDGGGGYEYCVSKLANVVFTQELARRTAGTGVTTYVLHPGVVDSDVWRKAPHMRAWASTQDLLTIEEGAATSLYCATSTAVAADSGLYYEKCAVKEPNPAATPELGAEVWKRSAEWTGLG
jgi:retinol dehydrogenase-12